MTLPLIPQNTQPLGVSGGTATGTTMPGDPLDPTMANLPVLKVTQRKKMPTGVASNVKQHILFLLDRSSSMSGSKINELNMAMAAILAQLASPENKDGFRVTIIPFNNRADVHCSAVPAGQVLPLNLVAAGGTNFDSPINVGIAEIQKQKAAPNPGGWHWLKPIVLFLSDGWAQVTDKNIQDFQEIAKVTAVAYGADADQATLSRIASDGQVHFVGTNGGALRDFFSAVGATMVSTMKAAT